MNVLFLHTPKFNNYCKPIGHYSFVLFPPIGLLGLADFLVKNNHTAKIIHLGVEQHQHGPLDFDRIISENQPLIVGLDLHWHFQSYDVIGVARRSNRRAQKLESCSAYSLPLCSPRKSSEITRSWIL
jgi:hypothetical protein